MRLLFRLLSLAVLAIGPASADVSPQKKDKLPKQETPKPGIAGDHGKASTGQSTADEASTAHITGMPATFVIPKNTCESGSTIQTLRRNLTKPP